MVKIAHTNIIVDEFSTARNNPFNKYVHFLSHIHTDHLKGLSNSWDYGTIYCSSITKKLLLLKYPRLKCLKQLQLDKQHMIALSSELEVTVTLYDSNHCAGGVMILFEGYMGTVLYSGDMRFDKGIYGQYNYLYPHSKRNKQFKQCSINIDFLYLDTTFLHPKFKFPPKSQALKQLNNFIQQTINKAKEKGEFIEFYIGIDSFGKEEVLLHLAQQFQTLVTVSEDRYKNISTIGLDSDYFTTDPEAGFIHIVLKRQLKEYISKNPKAMGIILTGWANNAHYRNSRLYAIPYSLHSSYPELVAFVDSLRPCFIDSIIDSPTGIKGPRDSTDSVSYSTPSSNNEAQLYENIDTSEYLNNLRNQYASKPSAELNSLINNVEFQKKINQKLKLNRTSAEISRDEFGMTTTFVRVQNINRAGAKFSSQRNQEEIEKIKEKLKNKKQEAKNKLLTNLNNLTNNSCSNKTIRISKLNRSNASNESQPVQIQDNQFQRINSPQNSQKSSKQKKTSNSSGRSSKQNHQYNNGVNFKQIEQDSQAARRNKWKKKMQLCEIDLFGVSPIPQHKPTKISIRSDNKNIKAAQTIKKPQKSQKSSNVIEILDEQQQPKAIVSNSNSSSRKRRLKRNSGQNKIQKQISFANDLLFQLPTQREPDQRSITEFFRKPSDKIQQINKQLKERVEQSSFMMRNEEADDEGDEQQQQEINMWDQQERKQNNLKNCNQFSIFQINLDKLDGIKEVSVENYKNFFNFFNQ